MMARNNFTPLLDFWSIRLASQYRLGEFSGQLFPWAVQEQDSRDEESVQLLGYVEPLPAYALARNLALQKV